MKNVNVVVASIAVLLGMLSVSACSQERSYVGGRSAGEQGAPFSSAVRVDDTLYISGMLGLENGRVPADPRVEARIMLDSIKAALEGADMTMDDLVHVTIYCTDLSTYDAFNEVYRSYFTREFPARAFIGTGSLLFGARFEMQSIAVKR